MTLHGLAKFILHSDPYFKSSTLQLLHPGQSPDQCTSLVPCSRFGELRPLRRPWAFLGVPDLIPLGLEIC